MEKIKKFDSELWLLLLGFALVSAGIIFTLLGVDVIGKIMSWIGIACCISSVYIVWKKL